MAAARHIPLKCPPAHPLLKMLMVALIVVVAVLFVIAVFAADRGVKARKRARLRRNAVDRLGAAVAGAEAREQDRRANQKASAALTSVMPAINDERSPRRV